MNDQPATVELRRMKRDGDHAIVESGELSLALSSLYPERVSLFLGKKHIARISRTDARWFALQILAQTNDPTRPDSVIIRPEWLTPRP